MDDKRSFNEEPMKGAFADPKTIKCKDCVFRDKTKVDLGDKVLDVGVTRAFCQIYQAPPKTNGKPSEILFQNGDCKYYEKDAE